MPDRGSDGKQEEPGGILPLHGGRHSLPADIVAFNQRERLLAALAEMVAEHGYNKTTIAQITKAASVSRRTFYEHFAGKEECFIVAYEVVTSHVESLMSEAVAEQADWPHRVAAALAALLRFFASRPQLARLCLVESMTVGEQMASRRQESSERLIILLQGGRAQRAEVSPLAEGIEEALVGGIFTLLGRRVVSGEAERLEHFTPAVVEFALAPYLGYGEARRIAAGES